MDSFCMHLAEYKSFRDLPHLLLPHSLKRCLLNYMAQWLLACSSIVLAHAGRTICTPLPCPPAYSPGLRFAELFNFTKRAPHCLLLATYGLHVRPDFFACGRSIHNIFPFRHIFFSGGDVSGSKSPCKLLGGMLSSYHIRPPFGGNPLHPIQHPKMSVTCSVASVKVLSSSAWLVASDFVENSYLLNP